MARVTTLCVFVLCAARAGAQDVRVLPTLEEIHDSRLLAEQSVQPGEWASQGPVVHYAVFDEAVGATSLIRYDLESDVETVVIAGETLRASDTGELVDIEGFSFSPSGTKVLLFTDTQPVWRSNTRGFYYLYDLGSRRLTPLSRRSAGLQSFAKFSPDGRRVGFVRNRNVFVVDLLTGRERQLTYDGSANRVINGTSDWVYTEEFGISDAWTWSPDGSRIAFLKFDESEIPEYPLTDLRGPYPQFETYRYPKAGRPNSEVKVGVIGVDSGTIRYIETGTWRGEEDAPVIPAEAEYITRIGWTPDVGAGSRLWMLVLNREQNEVGLLLAHPDTLEASAVLSEAEDAWVAVGDDKVTFLGDGRHFVWSSEAAGYNHLYLYRYDGTLVTSITGGRWEVTDFHGIDEQTGYAYFTAAIESPTVRHLYRIPVSDAGTESAIGPSPERISSGDGTHRVEFSPDMRYYIDAHSGAASPTTVDLRDSGGRLIRTLENNAELRARLNAHALPVPEFTTVRGADGDALNAWIIKPTDFDPAKRYPLLMYVYGGPGSQTVVDAWGGTRYVWHAWLADSLDVVVASVDGRGTGGRGKSFESQTHLRLGELEAADQVAAARQLGSEPWVDEERIGIWGWSYGGYVTLMSMLAGSGPDVFRVGIAVAPVTDWRLYHTGYTERYMSLPQRNPGGYERAAPVTYADRLTSRQKLLIVHGDLDDNVHFQQSVQMVAALQAAGKQFDLMMYPGRNHSLFGDGTRLHLFGMATNYVREHLLLSTDGSSW